MRKRASDNFFILFFDDVRVITWPLAQNPQNDSYTLKGILFYFDIQINI